MSPGRRPCKVPHGRPLSEPCGEKPEALHVHRTRLFLKLRLPEETLGRGELRGCLSLAQSVGVAQISQALDQIIA
jgi:hypothetical protein